MNYQELTLLAKKAGPEEQRQLLDQYCAQIPQEGPARLASAAVSLGLISNPSLEPDVRVKLFSTYPNAAIAGKRFNPMKAISAASQPGFDKEQAGAADEFLSNFLGQTSESRVSYLRRSLKRLAS